jgi:phage head maturation protease
MSDLSVRAERPTTLQRRNVPFRDVELRAKPDGTGGSTLTFTGYATVYRGRVRDGGLARRLHRGRARRCGFTKTLSEGADVPFLVNHGGLTLARTKSGTIKLPRTTPACTPRPSRPAPATHVAALQSAMERGDVDEMSLGLLDHPPAVVPGLRPARHPGGQPQQG